MRAYVILVGAMLAAAPTLADPPAPAPAPAPAAAPQEGITVNGQAPVAEVKPLGGGHIFISPMGQPFHSQGGVSAAELWFRQADANHDNRISKQEFVRDALRFFATLDTDHDHEISPDEVTHYEDVIAPEIRVLSTYGDPNLAKTDDDGNVTPPPYPTRIGAGRFGFLDAPEPVVSADMNLDRSITDREFALTAERRFKLLDTNGDGYLTRDELPRLDVHPERRNGVGNRDGQEGGRHHGGHHGGGGGGGGFGSGGGGGFGG